MPIALPSSSARGTKFVYDEVMAARPEQREGRGAEEIAVPVGIEKILFHAAVTPAFRHRLLAERVAAIDGLGLPLRPYERRALECVSNEALEAMISAIKSANPLCRSFMGLVAAAATSLVAGTASIGCSPTSQEAPAPMESKVDQGKVQQSSKEDAGSYDRQPQPGEYRRGAGSLYVEQPQIRSGGIRPDLLKKYDFSGEPDPVQGDRANHKKPKKR
jgi:hypothetical protein